MAIVDNHSLTYFEKRRKELRRNRFLDRLHEKPLMTQTRRARFEAVEHHGNAVGSGLGIEFYDCMADARRVPNAHQPRFLAIATLLDKQQESETSG